jgi:ribosome maturation factor RimP
VDEIREKLSEHTNKILDDLGLECVEIDVFQSGEKKIIRIYIDKPDGVTAADCALVSRELGDLLDLEELIPWSYNLEVSSPGLDRPLKTNRDFERNLGRFVRLVMKEKFEGEFIHTGTIEGVSNETLELQCKSKRVLIPRLSILNAKIEIQF